ncbi:NAD(P)H-hydrate dehydratase [Undibacterium sp. TJN19]|uniref:NAD(P)H-hydrate dehydratase n=1 Tax=Undibacterium sp. TJN19 TaxID=3413055 RepID=UPI003BF083FC
MPTYFHPEDRLYTIDEIRSIEAKALANQGAFTLMQQAGLAAADMACQLIHASGASGVAVLLLAGPGNNGGDAFEVAFLLSRRGYQATLIMCGDADNYSPDAKASLQRAQEQGVHFCTPAEVLADTLTPWSLIVDGLHGIGLKRRLDRTNVVLINYLNQVSDKTGVPVLALDVPSGLSADTGQPVGADDTDGITLQASHTITFIANKPGLHTGSGRDYAGRVSVAKLDIPESFFPPCHAHLNTRASLLNILQRRKQNSHKGSYGDVIIIGGASGMTGAAILAARAAQFSGAGRIYCGLLAEAPAYDSLHPEIMFRPAQELEFGSSTVVIGPGLGNSSLAKTLLLEALNKATSLLIDADALNMVAADKSLQNALASRTGATILSPHPLEAARLLGQTVAEVQADRVQAAHELASKYKATVILKGSGSIICDAYGEMSINPTGNPALSSGGTGDVLAGVCGALLAQKMTAYAATRMATWAHGRAADDLVARGIGPLGLTASELLPDIRVNLNSLTSRSAA